MHIRNKKLRLLCSAAVFLITVLLLHSRSQITHGVAVVSYKVLQHMVMAQVYTTKHVSLSAVQKTDV